MVQPPPALHRAILAVDVEGFGDRARTNLDQVKVRAVMYKALRHAFDKAAIPWDGCHNEDRGDGAFFLVPPEVPKAVLSGLLPSELAIALNEHNHLAGPSTRIRLRMVLHAGEVHYDEHGIAGAAVNFAFRLLDAKPVKSALAASPGNLALVVSEWFFEEVIRHDPASAPGSYRRIEVTVKETVTTARLTLPDHPDWQGEGIEPARDRLPEPQVCNLPPRNHSFVGRDDLVARLSAVMLERSSAVVLHGMPGVGKSQLARETAYRLADRFSGVWWVDAGRPFAASRDLAELADRLGVPQGDTAGRVRQLWTALARLGRWLLVYDNAGGEAELAPWWPPSEAAVLLVTSRSPHWQTAEAELVRPFTREESLTLLCGLQGPRKEADAVARELGDLPLALAQAAAYVARNRTDWRRYRDLLRDGPARLLHLHQPGDYPSTVAAALTLSLDRVTQEQPECLDLLRLLSFLDPDRIPRDLLHGPLQGDAPEGLRRLAEDCVIYDQAVGALAEYALLDAAPDDLNVHRLVQTMVREAIPPSEHLAWLEAAGRLLASRFPLHSRHPETWKECALLLPHVAAVAGPAKTNRAAPAEISALCQRAAEHLVVRGQHRQALELLGPALELRAQAFGPDSREYAQTLTTRGEAECYLGRHLRAVETARAALGVLVAIDSPDSPSVVPTLRLLGRALTEAGRPAEAIVVLDRAVRICTREFGDADARTAEVLARFAYALWRGGRLTSARDFYEHADRVWQAAGTRPDREQTVAFRWLACVLVDLGEYPAALVAVEEAIRMARALYGLEHVEMIRAEATLGAVLAGTGDLAEAERLQSRAVAFLREYYFVPVVVAGALTDLSRTQLKAGHLEDALSAAEEALNLYTEVHGTLTHTYNAGALTALGMAQHRLGRLHDAAGNLARADEIYRRAGGPPHRHEEVLAELADLRAHPV